LVRERELTATVRFEIGGLMSCRPAEELDAEMQGLYAEARKVDWMYEPTFRPRWFPAFPERLMFATLTCAPWTWVLVAPCKEAPEGFINVQTGETHKVVW
jgi:adenine deaminase